MDLCARVGATQHPWATMGWLPSAAWGGVCPPRRTRVGGGGVEVVSLFQLGRRTTSGGAHGYRSLRVRATGKDERMKNNGGSSSSDGNNEHSIPEVDDSDSSNAQSHLSHQTGADWRKFRANLIAREQVTTDHSDADADEMPSSEASSRVGAKWAHPIAVPETGCVLIATEKLDGVVVFERTVILLLAVEEGPFGVIINRPLHKDRKMKPTKLELPGTFADSLVHFGGPLDDGVFLVRSKERSPSPSFKDVVPGIWVVARNGLGEAADLVKKGVLKSTDFQFFVGCAGWYTDQLAKEIESGYWVVAACSPDLIRCTSEDSSSLWEDILKLMGGRYSELSRKPMQDGF